MKRFERDSLGYTKEWANGLAKRIKTLYAESLSLDNEKNTSELRQLLIDNKGVVRSELRKAKLNHYLMEFLNVSDNEDLNDWLVDRFGVSEFAYDFLEDINVSVFDTIVEKYFDKKTKHIKDYSKSLNEEIKEDIDNLEGTESLIEKYFLYDDIALSAAKQYYRAVISRAPFIYLDSKEKQDKLQIIMSNLRKNLKNTRVLDSITIEKSTYKQLNNSIEEVMDFIYVEVEERLAKLYDTLDFVQDNASGFHDYLVEDECAYLKEDIKRYLLNIGINMIPADALAKVIIKAIEESSLPYLAKNDFAHDILVWTTIYKEEYEGKELVEEDQILRAK
jgi:hypothetical protein